MLYREIIAVCSEIHTQHINTLCGQKVEFLNVKSGDTYSDHWAFRSYEYKHTTVLPPLSTGQSISISVSISSNGSGRANNGGREEPYIYFQMAVLNYGLFL